MDSKKFLLQEKDIPTAWFNIIPEMPTKPRPMVCVTNCACKYIGTSDPNDPLRGLMDSANGKTTQSDNVREF